MKKIKAIFGKWKFFSSGDTAVAGIWFSVALIILGDHWILGEAVNFLTVFALILATFATIYIYLIKLFEDCRDENSKPPEEKPDWWETRYKY